MRSRQAHGPRSEWSDLPICANIYRLFVSFFFVFKSNLLEYRFMFCLLLLLWENDWVLNESDMSTKHTNALVSTCYLLPITYYSTLFSRNWRKIWLLEEIKHHLVTRKFKGPIEARNFIKYLFRIEWIHNSTIECSWDY